MAISDKEFYETKASVQSNTKDILDLKIRVSDVEKKQELLYEMNQNIALMAQSLKRVEGDVSDVKDSQHELSQKVSTLENAPAKETLDNFKKIKIAAISAVVSGAAVAIAGMVYSILSK